MWGPRTLNADDDDDDIVQLFQTCTDVLSENHEPLGVRPVPARMPYISRLLCDVGATDVKR